MIIGIDHGYYAIKTKNFSFPAGVTAYTHEPYTLKNTLQIGGKYFVCGTGRQPILRDKTVNDNYYILTLAAIAMELRYRGFPAESSVTLAAGLPLARYGRDKKPFTEYLLRNGQPVNFLFEGERYKVKIESVKLFPQGYSAIAIHPELVKDEPSVLLMDIGGWTVDLMRLDNNVPNAATCRSLELGMIRCMDEIQEQVRRDTGLSVTDAQVERILAGKPCSMDEEARKLIQRQGRLYTERLISAAMEAGFDLRTLPVILIGGGAATVMRNVSERDGLCRAFLIGDDIPLLTTYSTSSLESHFATARIFLPDKKWPCPISLFSSTTNAPSACVRGSRYQLKSLPYLSYRSQNISSNVIVHFSFIHLQFSSQPPRCFYCSLRYLASFFSSSSVISLQRRFTLSCSWA